MRSLIIFASIFMAQVTSAKCIQGVITTMKGNKPVGEFSLDHVNKNVAHFNSDLFDGGKITVTDQTGKELSQNIPFKMYEGMMGGQVGYQTELGQWGGLTIVFKAEGSFMLHGRQLNPIYALRNLVETPSCR